MLKIVLKLIIIIIIKILDGQELPSKVNLKN